MLGISQYTWNIKNILETSRYMLGISRSMIGISR